MTYRCGRAGAAFFKAFDALPVFSKKNQVLATPPPNPPTRCDLPWPQTSSKGDLTLLPPLGTYESYQFYWLNNNKLWVFSQTWRIKNPPLKNPFHTFIFYCVKWTSFYGFWCHNPIALKRMVIGLARSTRTWIEFQLERKVTGKSLQKATFNTFCFMDWFHFYGWHMIWTGLDTI